MSTPEDVEIERIAKIAHEVNRGYCQALGDMSQTSWEDAPDWQKQSAINGVKFHLMNPAATPEDSHEIWMMEKVADGWKYGPEKDTFLKTHPCMVPYKQLLLSQRIKDYLFKAVVHGAK